MERAWRAHHHAYPQALSPQCAGGRQGERARTVIPVCTSMLPARVIVPLAAQGFGRRCTGRPWLPPTCSRASFWQDFACLRY